MTDTSDDGERRPSRGRGPKSRSDDVRPARAGSGPRKARGDDGDRPRPPRKPRDDGDGGFRPRLDAERPARSGEGERPRKPRDAGDRPFRARPDAGDRPRRPREDGDRPFRTRPDDAGDRPRASRGGDKPFRPGNGDDRPRKPRSDAERPARKLREDETLAPPATAPEPAEDRIAKVIARAGIASRRDAEAMIAEGRVTVNGEVLTSPALNVGPDDRVTVDGEPLPAKERTRLWLFHKPRGLVTTARDPEGRPTVFDNLPEDLPRVVAVGRLDINTEGLLLLTNDGGLAKVIAHPDTGWLRRYRVRAHGDIDQARLDALRHGISIEGMDYGPIEAHLDRAQGDNVWITLGLREGKNREVKRILEHLGLQVNRLIRLSFGPFQLGEIEAGMAEEVRTRVLRDQLGEALAREAEVDFESPVRVPIAPFGTKPEPEAGGERPRKARGEREDRAERGERPPRGERGDRFDRDERPRRGRDDARPGRGRPEDDKPERPPQGKERRPVWRADEDPEARPKFRRRVDPKEARAAAGAREHQRVGSVESPAGRKVLVERLVAEKRDEAEERPTRGPRRDAPSGDDRPRRTAARRDEGGEERPRRPARREEFGDREERRPRPTRGAEDRPRRASGDDERPARRGPPRGDRPDRGERPVRRFDGEGPARRGPPRGDRPDREPRPDRGDRLERGERPARRFDSDGPARRGPPRGERPDRGDRPERGSRPPRAGGPGRPRLGGDRPGGGGFRKGPGGGPAGGRPGGGRPGGKPGGPRGRKPV